MDPVQHDKIITDTLADIKAGVFDNLKALEERIAVLVLSGADASILRPQVMREFEVFQAAVKAEADKVRAISADAGVDTSDDTVAENALVNQTGNNIAKEFAGGAETIMTGIVLGAAAGLPVEQIARQARASISGVMMTTTDREVTRQQRLLTRLFDKTDADPAEIAAAVKTIRERLSDVNTTASLRDLTSKATEQVVMQFDGAYTFGKARRAGVQRWRYEGGLIDTSREWCASHQGETYTEDEIRDIWNSDDWPGKQPGDPFIVRGGWNCRHFWVPVEND